MDHAYSYQSVLAVSERVGFRLDDVFSPEHSLDFSRPFLPESLARSQRHQGLGPSEHLWFNQIAGHTYLGMFGLVEEFILPFVLDHVRNALSGSFPSTAVGDDQAVRALLAFAGEEAKHIELFTRFRTAFERDFRTPCELVGPPEQVARAVLSHRPLSVALAILHIEWMTQRHYVESVRTDGALEPNVANLLKQHWIEEAQHAKLDTLMAHDIAAGLTQVQIDVDVDGYLAIVDALDGLLGVQSELDVAALERARGAAFPEHRRAGLVRDHRDALRATFIGSGISHPAFSSTVATLSPRGAERVRQRARDFTSH